MEVTLIFIYLGWVFQLSTGRNHEVNRRLERAWSAVDILGASVWCRPPLVQKNKFRVFRALVLPVLLYSSVTWKLNGERKRIFNSFGTMSLRRILGTGRRTICPMFCCLVSWAVAGHLGDSKAPPTSLRTCGDIFRRIPTKVLYCRDCRNSTIPMDHSRASYTHQVEAVSSI